MGPEEAHLGHADITPFGNLILCGLSEDEVGVYGPYTSIGCAHTDLASYRGLYICKLPVYSFTFTSLKYNICLNITDCFFFFFFVFPPVFSKRFNAKNLE